MDKKDHLFNVPPVSQKKSFQGINFNKVLRFDDTHIFCGRYNFTYQDFYRYQIEHGNEACQLKDGTSLSIQSIWAELLMDFSFQMTGIMNQL